MPNIDLINLIAEVPDTWQIQAMLTITLPTPDKNVRPNIILTKEYLPKPTDLATYFAKIKESITRRGIKDLKISDEKDVAISGVRGKLMVCTWDVSQMAQLLNKDKADKVKNIQPGQMVKQIQVTLLKDNMAINMTASFPSDKFEIYYRPFQQFLKGLKIS